MLPPATVTRWVESIANQPLALDAVAALARRTDDPVRDLHPQAREAIRTKFEASPHRDRLLAVFEGEEDDRELGRIFGEELPSGLVVESA